MRRVLLWLSVATASFAATDYALEQLGRSFRRPPAPEPLTYFRMDSAEPVIVYPGPAS